MYSKLPSRESIENCLQFEHNIINSHLHHTVNVSGWSSGFVRGMCRANVFLTESNKPSEMQTVVSGCLSLSHTEDRNTRMSKQGDPESPAHCSREKKETSLSIFPC